MKNPIYKSKQNLDKKFGKFIRVSANTFLIGRLIPQKVKKLIEKIREYFLQQEESQHFDKRPLSNMFFGFPDLITSMAGFLASLYDSFKKHLKIKDTKIRLQEKPTSRIRNLDGQTSLRFKKIQFWLSILTTLTLITLVLSSMADFLTVNDILSPALSAATTLMSSFSTHILMYFLTLSAGVGLVKSLFKLNHTIQAKNALQKSFDDRPDGLYGDFENLLEFLRDGGIKTMPRDHFFSFISSSFNEGLFEYGQRTKSIFKEYILKNRHQRIDLNILVKCLERIQAKKRCNDIPESYQNACSKLKQLHENIPSALIEHLKERQLRIKTTLQDIFIDTSKRMTAGQFRAYFNIRNNDKVKDILSKAQPEEKKALKVLIENRWGDYETLKDLIQIVKGQRKEKLKGTVVHKSIGFGFEIVGIVLALKVFKPFPIFSILLSTTDLFWKLISKFTTPPWKIWGSQENRINNALEESISTYGELMTMLGQLRDSKESILNEGKHTDSFEREKDQENLKRMVPLKNPDDYDDQLQEILTSPVSDKETYSFDSLSVSR